MQFDRRPVSHPGALSVAAGRRTGRRAGGAVMPIYDAAASLGTVHPMAFSDRWRDFLNGRHAHLEVDEGLGWIVIYRGQVLSDDQAVSSPVPRVRHLAKQAALRNPNTALGPDETTFIWPQRSPDKGGA